MGAKRQVIAVAAALALARTGHAAAVPARGSECLICHSSPDLPRSGPPRPSSLRVDSAALAASPHAGLAFGDCHSAARSIPHAPRLAPVCCATCHADAAEAQRAGVHATGPTCVSCHGAHDARPAARMGPGSCAACHARETEEYRGSVHGVALTNGDAEASTCRDCHGPAHGARAATCNDCHESHRLRRATDPAASIYRSNIPSTCRRCHAREVADYRESVHGTAMARAWPRRQRALREGHGARRHGDPRSAAARLGPRDLPVADRIGGMAFHQALDFRMKVRGRLAANLLYLAGLRRTPPAFERFGYIEKAEYWALVWGTAVMTVTGVVLWFENQSMRWLNKWLLDLATLVHY